MTEGREIEADRRLPMESRLVVPVPLALEAAVERAARRQMVSKASFARSALLQALREDDAHEAA